MLFFVVTISAIINHFKFKIQLTNKNYFPLRGGYDSYHRLSVTGGDVNRGKFIIQHL